MKQRRKNIEELFKKNIKGGGGSLTPRQEEVFTLIAGVAANGDNLNENDLGVLRWLAQKGYHDPLNGYL